MMHAVLKISSAALMLVLLADVPATAVNLWDEKSSSVVMTSPDPVPRDSQQTAYHWQKARQFQQVRRYELAREHFLLALSACRTDATRDRLQRELQIIELQLRTLR